MSDYQLTQSVRELQGGITQERISSANPNLTTKVNTTVVWRWVVSLFNSLINNKANRVNDSLINATVNGVTIESNGDGSKVLLDNGQYGDYNPGNGGGGGDLLTDHISDIESPTYYYYGLNRNGDWEIYRNSKNDINIETIATISTNGGYADLTTAWAARISLSYT
jgi:hypothetical protein